jgi:hypothetical protein
MDMFVFVSVFVFSVAVPTWRLARAFRTGEIARTGFISITTIPRTYALEREPQAFWALVAGNVVALVIVVAVFGGLFTKPEIWR